MYLILFLTVLVQEVTNVDLVGVRVDVKPLQLLLFPLQLFFFFLFVVFFITLAASFLLTLEFFNAKFTLLLPL